MGVMLAPPLLDGTIPAFYSTDQGIEISIPFSMNRVVSLNQVNGFYVKIKTVQSGNQLCSVYVNKISGQGNEIKIIIDEDKEKFVPGQYYKIQVAYVNDGTIGYFSSVAIGKYTYKPEITINNLNKENLNSHTYTYIGNYNNADKTERIYSYKFNLYNIENKLVDTSGDLLHNSADDEPDRYTFSQDLPIGETHRVEYVVTTVNNLIIKSPKYRITQKKSISPELNASVNVSLNYDNGYISINLKANNEEELSTGFFIVSRACENSNYQAWEEIHRFSLIAQGATRHLCKDFTIEQGKNYIYAVQQYNNNGLYSNRILSDKIYADFEDAFLFDGKRQLKIRYNPKVSSFKKDLLETKTDTIGGKHPFIFRNGRVYYSEFPISGLISYQMDEENLFLSEEDYGLTEKTTNLTGENIAAERVFKMKVLEWLTNGEPKVYRSPAEGNYVVRLMNSSLSPNDTVGRMLHTFSSTAYEIAECNYTTLGEMGFITIEDQNVESLQWETFEFISRDKDGRLVYAEPGENLLKAGIQARTLRIDNMTPGDIITVGFSNGDTQGIKIGITGSYYIDTGVSINEIKLNTRSEGSMTYSYNYVKEPVFNNISDVIISEMPQHQFIGEHDILTELLYVWDSNAINEDGKQGNWVKNPKVELIEIYRIDIEKRPLQRSIDENNSNIDSGIDNILKNRIDPFLIYEVGKYTKKEEDGPRPGYPQTKFERKYYYDAFNSKKDQTYEPYILLNESLISVDEIEETSYLRPGKLMKLKSGNGVLVNLSYQMGIIKYNIEDIATDAYNNNNQNHYLYTLGYAINRYNNLQTKLEDLLDENTTEDVTTTIVEEIEQTRAEIKSAYDIYIIELIKGQKEDARRKGEIA